MEYDEPRVIVKYHIQEHSLGTFYRAVAQSVAKADNNGDNYTLWAWCAVLYKLGGP